MFAHDRRHLILELLAKRRQLPVEDLRRELQVSPATLRRDLASLEASRDLIRVHGGVMHPSAVLGETSFKQRDEMAVPGKIAIAEKAVQLVPDGATLLIDSGTTCLQLGLRLLPRGDLTLVTNSIPLLAKAWEQQAAAKLIAVGGELRGISGALTGQLATEWLRNFRADLAFLGASGLDGHDGLSTTELGEAAWKESLLTRSRQRILLATFSKWEQPSHVRFAGWEQIDRWVTDQEPNTEVKRAIKDNKTLLL